MRAQVSETMNENTTPSATTAAQAAAQPIARLEQWVEAQLARLSFELARLEVERSKRSVLRVFIDRPIGPGAGSAPGSTTPDPQEQSTQQPIGASGVSLEDCAAVSRYLDEQLDQDEGLALASAVFKDAAYDLEVSSPGVDRPLRSLKDYQRFVGRRILVHTYRPLTAEESAHPEFVDRYPKLKQIIGDLVDVSATQIVLVIYPQRDGLDRAAKLWGKGGIRLAVPFSLIAKASLEPVFELS